MSDYSGIDKNALPKHIALIVDGNRRWAKERGLSGISGHKAGAENINKLVKTAKEMGIKCISAWVFSTENWKRSKEEVKYLFELMGDTVQDYRNKFLEEKSRFVHIGRKDRIPDKLRDRIINLEEQTKNFDDFTMCLAIDYGGHDELVRTVNHLKDSGIEINEENIEKNLDTAKLPKIDLIIRTGGEVRLSGFMSWQCAYAELFFTKTHFPDFSPEELKKAVEDFSHRERRFGGDSKK